MSIYLGSIILPCFYLYVLYPESNHSLDEKLDADAFVNVSDDIMYFTIHCRLKKRLVLI